MAARGKKVKRSADEHRRRKKRGVERCISTPIPNHLSTCLSLPFNHKTTQYSVGIRKRGSVGMVSGAEERKEWKRKRKGK